MFLALPLFVTPIDALLSVYVLYGPTFSLSQILYTMLTSLLLGCNELHEPVTTELIYIPLFVLTVFHLCIWSAASRRRCSLSSLRLLRPSCSRLLSRSAYAQCALALHVDRAYHLTHRTRSVCGHGRQKKFLVSFVYVNAPSPDTFSTQEQAPNHHNPHRCLDEYYFSTLPTNESDRGQ